MVQPHLKKGCNFINLIQTRKTTHPTESPEACRAAQRKAAWLAASPRKVPQTVPSSSSCSTSQLSKWWNHRIHPIRKPCCAWDVAKFPFGPQPGYENSGMEQLKSWRISGAGTGNIQMNPGVRAAATLNYSLSKQRNSAGAQRSKSCLLPVKILWNLLCGCSFLRLLCIPDAFRFSHFSSTQC